MTRVACEIWILAGGLSTRMGRDKARVKVRGRAMLGRVRSAAHATGMKVRVIRKDIIPRCGPLGGVLTGLTQSKAEMLLFLPCDMPFVSTELLRHIICISVSEIGNRGRLGVFTATKGGAGFPFCLSRESLETAKAQVVRGEYSLQSFAISIKASQLKLPKRFLPEIRNFNTPKDIENLAKAMAVP
jgi:molybdopterin-guanine dinucleotide biosynthesis protein A